MALGDDLPSPDEYEGIVITGSHFNYRYSYQSTKTHTTVLMKIENKLYPGKNPRAFH